MAKTSDWKIVATSGATVDGRAITDGWIKEMAKAYATDEYTALIWPEHSRSMWGSFEGKNWGVVEHLKAEKRGGKLRLLAKITPNAYLLNANKDGQKLFTSIEPDPDYKGTGTCYLLGLAVTDSPASTGTTRLKFSKGARDEVSLELSQLEEIDFPECAGNASIFTAFATLAAFFSTPRDMSLDMPLATNSKDNDVTKEELATEMEKHFAMFKTDLLLDIDEKFKVKVNVKLKGSPVEDNREPLTDESKTVAPFSVAQFSAELEKQLKPLSEKITDLEVQFNALKKEAPGQENLGEGNHHTVEVY